MSTTATSPRRRNRASVACTACRARRTKCVFEPDHASCEYCRTYGLECVIRDDDERKRPKSKLFMNSMIGHIEVLENQLRAVGHEPPRPPDPLLYDRKLRPAKRQLLTRQSEPEPSASGQNLQSNSQDHENCINVMGTEPVGKRAAYPTSPQNENDGFNFPHPMAAGDNLVQNPLHQREDDNILPDSERPRARRNSSQDYSRFAHCLISKATVMSYEKTSSRIQYFSPTTTYHIYSKEMMASKTIIPESWQQKRTMRILSEVTPEANDYLMELFWKCYNNTLHFVDREAFEKDRENGDQAHYSGFLHLCCLGMGFRFADKQKKEIQRISVGNGSSIFHREANHAADAELENPQCLATVQALLILSELECAAGKEDSGWMYSGTACRLAFNFGLHLECSELGLPEHEMKFRRHVLRSCILNDRSWSLYLGRPTSIKSCDIAVSQMTDIFSRLNSNSSSTTEQDSWGSGPANVVANQQLYDAMLDLTDLATKIAETVHTRFTISKLADTTRMIELSALDSRLNSWHKMLPSRLKWTPENLKKAPPLLYVLHQQFHTALILLYGPSAQFDEALEIESQDQDNDSNGSSNLGESNSFSQFYRTASFENAVKIAQLLACYRLRFKKYPSGMFSLQHAGTAALVIVASIPLMKDSDKRILAFHNLRTLTDALRELSPVYQSAEVMYNVLDHVILRSGWNLNSMTPLNGSPPSASIPSIVPVRRSSGDDDISLSQTNKKRNIQNLTSTTSTSRGHLQNLQPPISDSQSLHNLSHENYQLEEENISVENEHNRNVCEAGNTTAPMSEFMPDIYLHSSNYGVDSMTNPAFLFRSNQDQMDGDYLFLDSDLSNMIDTENGHAYIHGDPVHYDC